MSDDIDALEDWAARTCLSTNDQVQRRGSWRQIGPAFQRQTRVSLPKPAEQTEAPAPAVDVEPAAPQAFEPLVCRSMDELVNALQQRKEQLNLSNDLIDDLAGLPDRYAAKLFCRMKSPGRVSLGPMLGALGLTLVMIEDPAAVERMKDRWKPRKRRLMPRPALPPPNTSGCVVRQEQLSLTLPHEQQRTTTHGEIEADHGPDFGGDPLRASGGCAEGAASGGEPCAAHAGGCDRDPPAGGGG
ncbi:hypothetical protein [Bradyrhizobium oligotrophicum]|uniref:hypothetical protein n=1 Tax=Bradyrhizobium oligotrophicum TaxID=44255 RepID=UPI003EBC53CA